ncbi:hypothetical protein [Schlesneria paludicola]|uniref:hypothetical protein n=1 Tax=Schlesneria paludicola TaxID=360056 RepID=UPI0012F9BF43|nr:hypothetical protein [Schlesneria paludicola]
METTTKRYMLRHFLSALAYRGANVLRNMPPEIADFRPSESVRSPREILNHMRGVLIYAHSFMVPYESTEPPMLAWNAEVFGYFEILAKLDASLLNESSIRDVNEEDLLQGPFADAMLHLGQIGIFRRMAGSPVASENYVFADIETGRHTRIEHFADPGVKRR